MGLRQRLDALDDRLGVASAGNRPRWALALGCFLLAAVVVAAAVARRIELLLFVPLVIGFWIAKRWAQRDR